LELTTVTTTSANSFLSCPAGFGAAEVTCQPIAITGTLGVPNNNSNIYVSPNYGSKEATCYGAIYDGSTTYALSSTTGVMTLLTLTCCQLQIDPADVTSCNDVPGGGTGFQCDNDEGYCLPESKYGNGVVDCSDDSDEFFCPQNYTCAYGPAASTTYTLSCPSATIAGFSLGTYGNPTVSFKHGIVPATCDADVTGTTQFTNCIGETTCSISGGTLTGGTCTGTKYVGIMAYCSDVTILSP